MKNSTLIPITPALFAGQKEDLSWLVDLVWCEDAVEAIEAIEEGHSALIPLENWQDTAETVLDYLGASTTGVHRVLTRAEIKE